MTPITDSQLNEIDAIFADLEWIDFKRPVWQAVRARLATAEADADRLALRLSKLAAHWHYGIDVEALRLHFKAVARREQP